MGKEVNPGGQCVQGVDRSVPGDPGGPAPVQVTRGGENMWGLLGRALEQERDVLAVAREGPGREAWDPGTADVIEQVRKDAAARERQVLDLVARL